MQKVGKKRETLAKVRNLCSLLCQEAMGMGLLTTNYGQLVQLPKNDTIGATPFSSTELKQIWAKADDGDTTAAAVLILNYTGMRPGELLSLEISTHIHSHGQQRYFKTGSCLILDLIDMSKKRSRLSDHYSAGFFLTAGLILIGQILIVNFAGPFFNVARLTLQDWILIISLTMPIWLVHEIYAIIMKYTGRRS